MESTPQISQKASNRKLENKSRQTDEFKLINLEREEISTSNFQMGYSNLKFIMYDLKITAKSKQQTAHKFKNLTVELRRDERKKDETNLFLKQAFEKIEGTHIYKCEIKLPIFLKNSTEKVSVHLIKEDNYPTSRFTKTNFCLDLNMNRIDDVNSIMIFFIDNNLNYRIILNSEVNKKNSINKEELGQIDKFVNDSFIRNGIIKNLKDFFETYKDCFTKLEEKLRKNQTNREFEDFVFEDFEVGIINQIKRVNEITNDQEFKKSEFLIIKSNKLNLDYKSVLIHQLLEIREKLCQAFQKFFDQKINPFIINVKKISDFINQLIAMQDIKELDDESLKIYNEIFKDNKELSINIKDLLNDDKLALKKDRRNYIKKLKSEAKKKLISISKENETSVKDLHKYADKILSFCQSIQIIFESDEFKEYFDNKGMTADNIEVQFKLYRIHFNIESVIFNERKYVIKDDFNVFENGYNYDYKEESLVIKEAFMKINNLIEQLKPEDDLMNYISFLNSEIIFSNQEPTFYFSEENTIDLTKKRLREAQFKHFILFEYKVIDNKLYDVKLNDEEKEIIIKETNNHLAFVNNLHLNQICCLNKKAFEKDENLLKKEKYFLCFLHELVHCLVYINIKISNNPSLKTPNIEELKKCNANKKKSDDAGDILEILMAVKFFYYSYILFSRGKFFSISQ